MTQIILDNAKMTSSKSKSFPQSLQPAIKRAKKAIQNYHLNPESSEKRDIALREIENANVVSIRNGNRRNWNKELLIVPHYDLFPHSWYCEMWQKETIWSIEKIPAWAENGSNEPNVGTNINGLKYTIAPKSERR